MPHTVQDNSGLKSRLEEFGLLSSSQLVLLPRNFETAASPSDFIYESQTINVQKYLKANGVECVKLPSSERVLVQKDISMLLPAIFIGAGLVSENTNYFSVALNVLSNYVGDFFKTLSGRLPAEQAVKTKVKFDCYVARPDGEIKRVSFDGPPEAFHEIKDLVHDILKQG